MDQPSSPLWWRRLEDSDPVSLEPLALLPYPPFALRAGGCEHLFDGKCLAECT